MKFFTNCSPPTGRESSWGTFCDAGREKGGGKVELVWQLNLGFQQEEKQRWDRWWRLSPWLWLFVNVSWWGLVWSWVHCNHIIPLPRRNGSHSGGRFDQAWNGEGTTEILSLSCHLQKPRHQQTEENDRIHTQLVPQRQQWQSVDRETATKTRGLEARGSNSSV